MIYPFVMLLMGYQTCACVLEKHARSLRLSEYGTASNTFYFVVYGVINQFNYFSNYHQVFLFFWVLQREKNIIYTNVLKTSESNNSFIYMWLRLKYHLIDQSKLILILKYM